MVTNNQAEKSKSKLYSLNRKERKRWERERERERPMLLINDCLIRREKVLTNL